jgi:hypothetical protein
MHPHQEALRSYEKVGVRAEEILVTSREMFITTSLLMTKLVLLCLH